MRSLARPGGWGVPPVSAPATAGRRTAASPSVSRPKPARKPTPFPLPSPLAGSPQAPRGTFSKPLNCSGIRRPAGGLGHTQVICPLGALLRVPAAWEHPLSPSGGRPLGR